VPRLPWECVILGIPVSVNTRNRLTKQRWRDAVQAAARAEWPDDEVPLACELTIHITYYHERAPLDVDNMMKPIQDALNGIVYVDDKQLKERHSYLRNLNGAFRVRGLSRAQADGFMAGVPFIHIRVEDSPPTVELP
jgi:crossover junction endodeoxyribonuclease RusA